MRTISCLFVFAAVFALLLVSPASAEEYVILTPSSTSAYYNVDFNQTAVYINTTLSPNATIVRFDLINDTARAAVAAKNPKYIYLVIQAANLSPDFLNSVDNLTRYLDSDPYVDAGWSILSGYDNTSARSLFDRDMDSAWSTNYVLVPNNANAQVAAGNQVASLFGTSALVGASVTNTSVKNALSTSTTDFLYFSANPTEHSTTYTKLASGDDVACPAADSNNVACDGGVCVTNLLFFADASEAARVNGTNSDSTWLLQNSSANHTLSLPITFSRSTGASPSNAAAYIAPHSTRWATSENVAKFFVSSLSHGNDIISALQFAKNMLLFNGENESLSTNFTTFVASEYNLFGKIQKPSTASIPQKTYALSFSKTHESNLIVYSENITNITWNGTYTISVPSTIAALYNPVSGWASSGASVWYKNVSEPSSGKVNFSFVSSVSGEIVPDSAVLSLQNYNGSLAEENITAFNIAVNETYTWYNANESLQNHSVLRYASDVDRIYFVRLFSPNATLSSTISNVNISYTTGGITTNRTAIAGTENILSETFSLQNPIDENLSATTLLYELPYNITTNCTVSQLNCTIVDVGTTRYANITFTSLPSGTTVKTIAYNTSLDVNTTKNYSVFNLGETMTVISNVTSTENDTVLDYTAKLVNSTSGAVLWSSTTEDIMLSSGLVNTTTDNYVIPQTTNPGTYALKIYYLSNGTSHYASYEFAQIQITNELNISNATYTYTAQNKSAANYFFVNDSITATGNVYDIHDATISSAAVNISLVGTTIENTTSTITSGLGSYVAPFSWTGSSVGSKVLQVAASHKNNTKTQNDTLYITRYIADNISVTLDKARSTIEKRTIYNTWETPKITVTVRDPSGGTNYVYKAPVSVNGITTSGDTETALNGSATMTFTPAATNTYAINVSAYSPLNTTKIVYNATESLNVMWLESGSGYFVATQSPTTVYKDNSVTFTGNLTLNAYSGANTTLMTNPSMAYQLKTGGSDVTSLASCAISWPYSDSRFSITCTPKSIGSYQLIMQAGMKYDGVQINTNDTYTFSVSENTTVPATPPTTTSTSTVSSTESQSCTTNTDCSSGDYCLNSVCTAISCPDGAIVNHTCVPNKKISIISAPTLVVAKQNGSVIANFTVSNNGSTSIFGLTFTLTLSNNISWTSWYSFITPMPSSLNAGAQSVVSINITIPDNTSIEKYLITAKAISSSASDEKIFALQVSPSDETMNILSSTISAMNDTIKELEEELSRTMKDAPENQRNLTERKLDKIRELCEEAEQAISEGDYFEAYAKQKEISDIMSDIRIILADNQTKESSFSITKIVLGFLIIIAAIAGGFYYLWTPQAEGYKLGKGYCMKNKKKDSAKKQIELLKKKVSKIQEGLLKKLKASTSAKKYGYKKSHSFKR